MQPKNILPLMLAVVLLAAAPSCKKEKVEEPVQTKTEMLTTGKWKISAYTVNPATDIDGDGVPDADLYAFWPPCEKDNWYAFHKDGKFEVDQGQTFCDPSEPQKSFSAWSFANDEKEIVLGSGRPFTIAEMTPDRFRLQFPSGTSTAEYTFSR